MTANSAGISDLCKGELTKWKDDRGFGFIKPDDGSQEVFLHLCELLGGWPGAFLAQYSLRHKNRKVSFQVVFWAIVAFHLFFWVDWLFLDKTLVRMFPGVSSRIR
jgi:hypothetical protein